MKSRRFAFLFILALSACASQPPPSSAAPLDYGALGKINLDVKDLSFVDRGVDQSPSAPIMADQFQPTIAEAVHQWATERLQAVGTSGEAAFVVKNAYVTQQALPADGSWFERPQAGKITGHIDIELDARGSAGAALATANATRSVSLPENPTGDEKYAAYRALLDGLMQDVNTYLDEAIHEHMRDFVVTAPVIGSKLPPVPQSPGQAP